MNLVDFGFSSRFVNKKGAHIQPSELDYFRGNLLTASLDHIKQNSPSRKDDLISLVYLAIFLVNTDLPWNSVDEET
jgi:hypothetical protein